MDIEHQVEIVKGKHSTQVPSGMPHLFRKLFSCSDFNRNYHFKVLLGERLKGSALSKEIEVKNVDSRRRSVTAIAKPGDNGTRHKCYILRPNGYSESLEEFQNRLKKGEEKMLETECGKITDLIESIRKGSSNTSSTPKDEQSTKSEDMAGNPEDPKLEGNASGDMPVAKKYRRVAHILKDATIVKCILMEISETGKDRMLQSELKKIIKDNKLDCETVRVIDFLEKEGYIKKERESRTKIFIFLSKKGMKFIGVEGNSMPLPAPQLPATSNVKKEETRSEYDEISRKIDSLIILLKASNEKTDDLRQKAAEINEELRISEEENLKIKNQIKELKNKGDEIIMKLLK